MTKQELDDRLAGIQLAIFEFVWPIYSELKRMYLKVSSAGIDVVCEFEVLPESEDWTDCIGLLEEIFDAALEGKNVTRRFTNGDSAPADGNYDVIMSEAIFRQIAQEVAPWRLEAGR